MPGPRWKVNWLLWYWFAVVLLIISQNGGIVGGVGQSLAMAMPVTASGEEYNVRQDELVQARVALAEAQHSGAPASETTKLDQNGYMMISPAESPIMHVVGL